MAETIHNLNLIKEKLHILDENFNKTKEKVAHEYIDFKVQNKLDSVYRENSQIFKLNFGGEPIEINKKTIGNCKFENILSEHIYKTDNKTIFIDLNPIYFPYILQIARAKDLESNNSVIDLYLGPNLDLTILKSSIKYFFKEKPESISEVNFVESKKVSNQIFAAFADIVLPENLKRGRYIE